MKKIYYDIKGWVCDRYPYDIPKSENFLEVDEETYQKTLTCETHKSWRVFNGNLVVEDYEEIPTQELAEIELFELENWFTEYDLQVKQYGRATRLGEIFDKSIEMLDNEAREKAIRINELRKLVEG